MLQNRTKRTKEKIFIFNSFSFSFQVDFFMKNLTMMMITCTNKVYFIKYTLYYTVCTMYIHNRKNSC